MFLASLKLDIHSLSCGGEGNCRCCSDFLEVAGDVQKFVPPESDTLAVAHKVVRWSVDWYVQVCFPSCV